MLGRSSTFSAAQTRTIVAILLADLLPGVKADCTVDRFGDEHCTLSVAARVGLGFLLAFLIIALAWYMRYRHRRAAQIYIANALQNQQNARSANNGSGGPRPPNTPQYPPPARGSPGAVPLYAYDPSTGFAPPARSPPQYYTPPPGMPPVEQYKVPYHREPVAVPA
ncbi:hypothetical protein EDB83DRAFT_287816 [Lactarius deliciosus]|nr:hypothetical protein EDB83DRAFT_287816 [Lactarius deliciosus]